MSQHEIEINNKIDGILTSAVSLVDKFVSKSELNELVLCDVKDMSEKYENLVSMDIFSMRRLAYNPKEGIVDKLVNVYSAMHSLSSTVFIIIQGREDGTTEFNIGTRCLDKPGVAGVMLKNNFEGNFPGIVLEKKNTSEKNDLMDNCFPLEYERKSLVSLSVSADFRQDKREDIKSYFQGVEKFIDSMKGHSYTAMFLAEPVDSADCKQKRISYENMITELSKYKNVSVAYNEGTSVSINSSLASSITDTVSDSISHSVSTNTSKSIGKTKGRNSGTSYNFVGGHSSGSNSSHSKTTTTGSSDSDTDSKTIGKSTGTTKTNGESSTTNSGFNMTLNVENKHISQLISKLEYELEKLGTADSYGLWDAAVYIVAESEDVALIAANSVRSLIIGDESGKAESFINSWSNDRNTYEYGSVGKAMKFLHYGMHPVFKSNIMIGDSTKSVSTYVFTPAVSIGGNILPALMGLPMKSVPGITVMEMAEFGRNIVTDNIEQIGNRKIKLGEVVYMGKNDLTPVELSVNSLSGHVFICGSPGSGKSNTTNKIIQEFVKLASKPERDDGFGAVNFMVIEPAKGEYKYDFGNLGNVNIFTTKNDICQLLKINPFEFPYEDMEVTTHINRLMNIISACWPLTAAMPAILNEALHKAYISKGWDLDNSIYILPGQVRFPSFKDVLSVLPNIIDSSSYSSEAKGDYTGALVTRVMSLVTGLTGKIFDETATIPDGVLFDGNTIIDLSDIGSNEVIALIMGVIIMKLENYRKSNVTRANCPLRHVTILEEAHNILPSGTLGSSDGVNIQEKSVKAISKAISEMRTYGEGFIIVDQSPSAVSDVAIAYTSTKIVMRLPGQADINVAAASLGLNDEQKSHIPMLPQGQAIVKQGDWLRPIVVKVDKAGKSFFKKNLEEYRYEDLMEARGKILKKIFAMIKRNGTRDVFMKSDINSVVKVIEESDIAVQYIHYFKNKWLDYCSGDYKKRNYDLPELVVDILSFRDAFFACPIPEKLSDKSIRGHIFMKSVDEWSDLIEGIVAARYVIVDDDTFEVIMFNLYKYCTQAGFGETYKLLGAAAQLRIKMR